MAASPLSTVWTIVLLFTGCATLSTNSEPCQVPSTASVAEASEAPPMSPGGDSAQVSSDSAVRCKSLLYQPVGTRRSSCAVRRRASRAASLSGVFARRCRIRPCARPAMGSSSSARSLVSGGATTTGGIKRWPSSGSPHEHSPTPMENLFWKCGSVCPVPPTQSIGNVHLCSHRLGSPERSRQCRALTLSRRYRSR